MTALTSANPSTSENSLRHAKDTIARLQKSEVFRDYQQAFETLTGLPLALRAVGAFQSPMQNSKRANPFCVMMASTNKTCAACLLIQERIEEASHLRANTLECFAGLSDSAVPIRMGETVIGFLQTGQVFLQRPTKARFKVVARQLTEWGFVLDNEKLEDAYMSGRQMTTTQFQSILRLLTIFADHLSQLSNQIVLAESAAESPVIAKARAYIEEHKTEELSLSQVAQAVNMSAFYFCKVFRKGTGATFTDYVSRVRAENVKQLLLNPHKRVSEAAFEAGFQSLSQFNRTFRRVTGESPSTFRQRIHSPVTLTGNHCHSVAA